MSPRFLRISAAPLLILALLCHAPAQSKKKKLVYEGAAQYIGDIGVSPENLQDSIADGKLLAQLKSAHDEVSSIYGLKTTLLFYDDGGGNQNAFVTRDPEARPGPDGSVLFGENFAADLAQISSKTIGGINIPIFSFMAHEEAHNLQVKQKSTLIGKERELQADYIAGWALALYAQKLKLSDEAIDGAAYEASTAVFSHGDYKKESTDHHGVKRERQVAFLNGVAKGDKGDVRLPDMLSKWEAPPSNNSPKANTVEIGRTGYIPGLEGRLNPILDDSNRTYLYASNISIEGGKVPPVNFEINKPFTVEDRKGNKFSLKITAITRESATIEYTPFTGAAVGTGVVRDSAGRPVSGAEVYFVFGDGTFVKSTTDTQGKIEEVALKNKTVTLFCVHHDYRAAVVNGYNVAAPTPIVLSGSPGTGSVVINRAGYVPGLEGRLNPKLDDSNRTYVYADDMSVDGRPPQKGPVDFRLNKPFAVQDRKGNRFTLNVVAITNELSVIEYTKN